MLRAWRKRAGASLSLIVWYLAPCPAAVLYVDSQAATGGSGDSWNAALRGIGQGLAAAIAGDEIWVKEGLYRERIQLREGVSLYGGFSGTEASRDERDHETHTTILKGSGQGSVVTGADDATLDGFIITGGTAQSGGGISCEGTSPTIANCRIEDNDASYGGGIYCRDSSAKIRGCAIARNRAREAGGGLYGWDSPLVISGCLATQNLSEREGGGAAFLASLCEIADTVFADNVATEGGALWCNGFHAPMLENCRIVRNFAERGAALSGSEDFTEFERCTIAGNASSREGSGFYCRDSRAIVHNSIVWGNLGGSFTLAETSRTPIVTYSLSDDAWVVGGAGNMLGDPLFVGWGEREEIHVDSQAPPLGDGSEAHPYASLEEAFRSFSCALASGSPCIGAGEGGVTMGAATGVGVASNVTSVRISLAPGTYPCGRLVASWPALLAGAGDDATILEGSLLGLATGCRLQDLAVTKGMSSGLAVGRGQSPEIVDVRVAGNGSPARGGGVLVGDDASPTFTRTAIEDNDATYEGGGIYCGFRCAPVFTSCTIARNEAPYGGGIAGYESPYALEDCIVSDNSAPVQGGGLFIGGEVRIIRCTIERNDAAFGGGIAAVSCGFEIAGCSIADNVAQESGGGLAILEPSEGGPFSVRDSSLLRNRAQHGGAVFVQMVGSDGGFSNCLIAENRADHGGAVYSEAWSKDFDRCTIANNVGIAGVGGIFATFEVSISNSIVWGNGLPAIEVSDWPDRGVRFSCIEGSSPFPGEGNIAADPRFAPPGAGGDIYVDALAPPGGDGSAEAPYQTLMLALGLASYRLCDTSPCLGAGEGGTDMGASLGISPCAGGTSVVHIAAGSYDLSGLQLPGVVSLEGAGADATVLNGTLLGLRTGSTLAGVAIENATAGGIVIGAGESPEIRNCAIRRNRGPDGGGIVAGIGSAPTLHDCAIVENQSDGGGGIRLFAANATLYRCTIADNRSSWSGGGILAEDASVVTLEGCEVSRNVAGESGGGLALFGGQAVLRDTVVRENAAEGEVSGGGGGLVASEVEVQIEGCAFTSNRSGMGGGCAISHCTGSIEDTTFDGNSAGWGGGMHLTQGPGPSIRRCLFVGNRAGWGGALHATLWAGTVEDSTFTMNAAGRGAALYLYNCQNGILERLTVAGNAAAMGSIAFWSCGAVRLADSIVWDNGGRGIDINSDLGIDISYSCVQGDEALPGTGNIRQDPRFAGWQGATPAYVDAAAAPGGDGSQERPYRELRELRNRLSFALAPDSPCIGAGEGGSTMGAGWGIAAGGGSNRMLAIIAAGEYSTAGISFASGLSARGAGAEATVLRGTVSGMRSGCSLEDLSVEGSEDCGVWISWGESPTLERVTVRGAAAGGVWCDLDSAPNILGCRIVDNASFGIRAAAATLNIRSCEIMGTTDATDSGALALSDCHGSVAECRIAGTSGTRASGIRLVGGDVVFTDSTVEDNEAAGVSCRSGTASFERSHFRRNLSGGVECLAGSAVAFRDCDFNEHPKFAYVLYAEEATTVEIVDSRFAGNLGLAVYALKSQISLRSTAISDNRSSLLAEEESTVSLEGCRVTGNAGGTWASDSTVTMVDCLVAGNHDHAGYVIRGNRSTISMTACTVSGNVVSRGAIVHLEAGAIRNSIIHGNCGNALYVGPGGAVDVSYSCIEAAEPWPGTGTIAADPRFVGWAGKDEVFVDAQALEGGDGSAERPYRDLGEAVGAFSYSLADSSPCIGAGEGGATIGANLGIEPGPLSDRQTIRVAPGTYAVGLLSIAHGLSLFGGDAAETTIVGIVAGLDDTCSIEGVTIADGWTTGLICAGQGARVARCAFTRNGCGIQCSPGSRVIIEGCEIRENAVSSGLYVDGAEASVSRCTFEGNVGTLGGGIVGYFATLAVSDSVFTGNVAASQGGSASALYYGSTGIFARCRFSGNSSPDSGVIVGQDANLSIESALIAGNDGYAFALRGDSTCRCVNATIATTAKGLVAPSSETPAFVNTIVWDTAAPRDFVGDHCLVGIDPNFVREGRYDLDDFRTIRVGNRELRVPDFIIEAGDYRLRFGSLAIDAGSAASAPPDDLDGVARPCGEGWDAGAYEFCSTDPFRRGDANNDGATNIGDPIFILSFLFRDGRTPSCLDAADGNDDGALNIGDPIRILMHLFRSGGPLPEPFEACGSDPTADILQDCNYPLCVP